MSASCNAAHNIAALNRLKMFLVLNVQVLVNVFPWGRGLGRHYCTLIARLAFFPNSHGHHIIQHTAFVFVELRVVTSIWTVNFIILRLLGWPVFELMVRSCHHFIYLYWWGDVVGLALMHYLRAVGSDRLTLFRRELYLSERIDFSY